MSVVPRRLVLALALVTAGLMVVLVGIDRPSSAVTTSVTTTSVTPAGATAARTWVVDAIDDPRGNRWESVDTGTSEVTVAVGDTVEWQFDRAAQEHDLTSQDTSATWQPPLQQWRAPDGEPVDYTFTEPGVYDYLCSIHGTVMQGRVVVLAADPDNRPPTVAPMGDVTTGPAPLTAHLMAMASDPDGDTLTYHWDLGNGSTSTEANPTAGYTTPGSYTAVVEVSDGRGGTARGELPITVTDGGTPPTTTPTPGGDTTLPEVAASAVPAAGTAPLAVAFSADVTTSGTFAAFADGLTPYPDLTGHAGLTRSRGLTRAWLDVTGLRPGASHLVHVHEQACASSNGGAHFRFDTDQPFGEANEIWLPFTADATGASGRVEVTRPLRAGAAAVSMVIHDPDNPAKRIGCVDLAPSTADLVYAWDLGDGTMADGPDPDHVYAAPGTYLATLTVSSAHAAHEGAGTPDPVTASVRVVVAAPPDRTAPRTSILGGASGLVGSRSATFRLASDEPGADYSCRVDGGAWRACASPLTLRGLRDGFHLLEARARDRAGNTDATPATRTWTVDTRRPVVGQVRPGGTTHDRTPTIRVRVRDAHLRPGATGIVLRVDGRRVPAYQLRVDRGRLTWTPRRAMSVGRHLVRVTVVDAAGNRKIAVRRFRIVR